MIATVVWRMDAGIKVYRDDSRPHEILLSTNDKGKYKCFVNSFSRNDSPTIKRDFDALGTLGSASLKVQVSPQFFAKEPPEWESWWVNLWYEEKPEDQCHFRKRRIPAYSIQLVAVPVWIVLITVLRVVAALVLLLCGQRGVELNILLHPFSRDTDELWENANGSVFLMDSSGVDRDFGMFSVLISPIVQLYWFEAFVTVYTIIHAKWGWFPELSLFQMLYWAPVVMVLVLGIVFASIVGVHLAVNGLEAMGYDFVGHKPDAAKKARISKEAAKSVKAARSKAAEELRRREELDARLATVSCEAIMVGPDEFTLAALPPRARTIYLRLQEVKARICQPFSR